MRPSAVEILRGVQTTLLQTVAGEIKTPAVRAQVQYAAGLLALLAQDWDDEAQRLAEEIRDLRAGFGRLAALLPSSEGPSADLVSELRSAAAEPPGEDLRLSILQQESERLRDLLSRLVVAAAAAEREHGLPRGLCEELDTLLRRTAGRRRGLSL